MVEFGIVKGDIICFLVEVIVNVVNRYFEYGGGVVYVIVKVVVGDLREYIRISKEVMCE